MAGRRRHFRGVVVSDRPKKTVVVEVARIVLHPKYKRYVRRRSRLYAHDPREECRVGDRVEVVESRPLSRLKRFRVVRRLGE